MESEVAVMPSRYPVFSILKSRGWLVTILVIVAAGIVLAIANFGSGKPVEYFTQPVAEGSVLKVVNATGTVEPVVTVQVGSQVSGQIRSLYADYNSIVKRGQLLAKIDPRNFQAQVADAEANLAAAKAREQAARADLGTMQENLVSAQANLKAAQVTRDNDALNYDRYRELSRSGVISANDYDTVKTTAENSAAKYDQARAAVGQAQAQIAAQEAQIQQAHAQVQQAKADLDDRRVSLEYTDIYSPVDGVVISRNVDVGQTVAAGLQAPLLFVIANDLTHMQVNASVDEADIGVITPRVDVQFTVDAFPNRPFSGKIQEIRLNPQTAQNVVTYDAIVAVDNHELYLKPGMTANITITVDKRDNVLKIPNAALRYMPQGTTAAEPAGMARFRETTDETNAALNRKQESHPSRTAAPPAADTGRTPDLSEKSAPSKNNSRSMSASDAGTPAQEQAPGQLWDPSGKLRFPTVPAPPARAGSVWTLDSRNHPMECPVKLGITDGAYTEIVAGNLHKGEPLIIADTSQDTSGSAQTRQAANGPLRGFRRF
jgi:HlyD family secretion protein